MDSKGLDTRLFFFKYSFFLNITNGFHKNIFFLNLNINEFYKTVLYKFSQLSVKRQQKKRIVLNNVKRGEASLIMLLRRNAIANFYPKNRLTNIFDAEIPCLKNDI